MACLLPLRWFLFDFLDKHYPKPVKAYEARPPKSMQGPSSVARKHTRVGVTHFKGIAGLRFWVRGLGFRSIGLHRTSLDAKALIKDIVDLIEHEAHPSTLSPQALIPKPLQPQILVPSL